MIEIFATILLASAFYIICIHFINDLETILLSIIFFPFIFKDKTGFFFYQNFKDIFLLLLSIIIYLKYLIPLKKKEPKIVFYFHVIFLIIVFVPLINLFFNIEILFISISFIAEFVKSIILPICYLIIFFSVFVYFNNNTIKRLFEKIYFILFFIFLEFLTSIILKQYLDLQVLRVIYPENIFRSIFINGHIATLHFFIFGYFLGFYFFKLKKEKKYLLINFLFLIIILFNLETRLTLGAFIFTNIILALFSFKNINYREKNLFYSSITYTFIIFTFVTIIVNFFGNTVTSIQPDLKQILFLNFDIWPTPIIERVNTNIFFIENLISNYFIGFGYDNVGSFTSVNNLEIIPKIFISDFDHLSYSFLHSGVEFVAHHGSTPRVHSGILNIIISYGLFSIVLIYIFIKIFNFYDYNCKVSNPLKEFVLITITFFICSSIINYIYEVEILVTLLIAAYIITRKKNEI